jgi:hypothetical protein
MHALLAGVAALALWHADEPAADHLPTAQARLYAAPSARVWQAARELLTELGLRHDELAEKDQFVVTKWEAFKDKRRPDLPATERSDGLRPERFQLHVYVSPHVEPARVHLGSVVEYKKPGPAGIAPIWGMGYGVGIVEEWFFGKLEAKLAQVGQAIPKERIARAKLAASLLGGAADPCLARLSSPRMPAGDIVPPAKIRASEVEVLYPVMDRDAGREAKVVAEFTVGEDGAVYDQHLVGATPAGQFRNSVLGAVSLLRYRPVRQGECPWPSIMTYTVNFKLR